MLIPMIDLYVSATGDIEFLRQRISTMEKEMEFWLTNRTVSVNGHTLAQYNVEYDGPRPESYRFVNSPCEYERLPLQEHFIYLMNNIFFK